MLRELRERGESFFILIVSWVVAFFEVEKRGGGLKCIWPRFFYCISRFCFGYLGIWLWLNGWMDVGFYYIVLGTDTRHGSVAYRDVVG